MRYAYLVLILLVFIPTQAANAATWIDSLYDYKNDGLISDVELQTALSYLYESGIIQHSQTVYYSVDALPALLEHDFIPTAALERALDAWEDANPGLVFVESADTDIVIKWTNYLADTHVGLATCYEVPHIDCTLDIALGDYDCTGKFVQSDVGLVTDTIMHEIGHALGLGHTDDESHLMYGDDGVATSYWNGYVVPDALDTWFVGQKVLDAGIDGLDAEIDGIDAKIAPLDVELAGFDAEFDVMDAELVEFDAVFAELDAELERIDNEMVNAGGTRYDMLLEEYNTIVVGYNEFVEQQEKLINKYNALIAEQETLVEAYNTLVDEQTKIINRQSLMIDEYNCYPNIELDTGQEYALMVVRDN